MLLIKPTVIINQWGEMKKYYLLIYKNLIGCRMWTDWFSVYATNL